MKSAFSGITRRMRFALVPSLVGALVAGGFASSAFAQTKWDLATGYSPGSFQTENVQQFANDVDKATDGKLKIALHPNGSLFKANEIKRAVQSGQVPAGEFILSGASNENPIFGVDSIPFLATSYGDAKKLWAVQKPALEKYLAGQGVKLLFVSPWPPQSLYSRKPVSTPADLRGTKMRAYNPATSRIAVELRAQPTTIQLAELAQALTTGGVDNFLTSSASGVETKLYEHVKYLYEVNAWLPKNAVVVSQKSFDALDAAAKAALLKAAADAEARGFATSEEKNKGYLTELKAKGMTVAPPTAALNNELKKIGDAMIADWVKDAGADGKALIDAYRK
jgi:TRAP-type transport system periplasmic protein